MFENIGRKIKIAATVTCVLGMLSFIALGIVLMVEGDWMVLVGLLVAVLGSLVCWLSVFLVYGFGQLVENSDKLVAYASIPREKPITEGEKVEFTETEEPQEEENPTRTYTPIRNEYCNAPQQVSRDLNIERKVMSILNLWRALGKISQKELDTFVENGGMKEIRAKVSRFGSDLALEGALLDILNRWRAEETIS